MKHWAEKEVAERHEKLMDEFYREIWGKSLISIIRTNWDDDLDVFSQVKDKDMGIDVTLVFLDGCKLVVQEKTRRARIINGNDMNHHLNKCLKNGNPCYDLPIEIWNKKPGPIPVNIKPEEKRFYNSEDGEYRKIGPQFHSVFYNYDGELCRKYIIITPILKEWLTTVSFKKYPGKRVYHGMCEFKAIPIEDIIKEIPQAVFYDSMAGNKKYPYLGVGNLKL